MKIMKKRLLILLFALATAVCLGVGLAACGDSSSEGDVVADVPSQSTETEAGTSSSTTKQAPVYQGMVISSADSASTLSSEGAVKSYSALAGGAGEPGASADATGALTGDVNIEGVDIDTQIHLGGDDEPTIEDEITARFGVTGTGQSIYYADPGEEILITVKFSNPDDYEILSFRINGKTYASYMFQDGSDMENIIVKLDVGTKIGFADFTIDEIKYIDGTEIKDVMLNGETSVRCGIRTDDIPYATVIEETAGIDTITLNIRIIDLYGLIEASDGYCFIALYDGDTMTVYEEYLHEGYNEIVFTGLDANTVYEYAVVAIYDNLSGDGENSINYLCENCLRTEAVVLFDDVSVTKTGVSFSYLWYEGYEYAEIHKLSLESEGDTRLTLLDSDATEITGLLSNTRYTLTASYTGPDGSVGSIHMSFTTLAMEAPEITIDSVSATKTDITYSVTVIDKDTTGYVSSVAVIRDGSVVNGGLLLSGTVSGLLSDNEYTLVVTYVYDLNDGYGERTMEVTANVTTEAVTAPEFEIYTLSSTKEEISYVLYIEDADEAGYLFSVELHMGKMLAGTLFAADGVFENLYSDTEYTIKAEYVYDLNDGYGARTMTLTETVSTKAKAAPEIEIGSLTSTKEGISYSLYIRDADETGYLFSVELHMGKMLAGTLFASDGVFENLYSDTEYTIKAEYVYDLNDGYGARTMTITETISTQAVATPEIVIYYLTSTTEEISYELVETDKDNVGEIVSIELYQGVKYIAKSSNIIGNFDGLLSGVEYTLVVTYSYDLCDGLGTRTAEVTSTVSTKAKKTPTIEIYNLIPGKEDITYELAINDADGVGYISSLTLSRGSLSWTVDPSEYGTFTNLLSDNEYTLAVIYVYDLNDGGGTHSISVEGSVSTLAKETPEVDIYSLTSTKNSVEYELVVTDTDGVGGIVSVTLTKGNTVYTADADVYGSFMGLLSDNEYTLVIVYEYDLGDGYGTHTLEISRKISTIAASSPQVTIDSLTASKDGIDYVLYVSDEDGVITGISVTLVRGEDVVGSAAAVSGEFGGLLSGNEYTLTVVYTYDLWDGQGERTIEINTAVATVAKELPSVTIDSLTSTKEGVAYEYSMTDVDGVGMDVSVSLSGAGVAYEGTLLSGEFDGLLSDNEYTLSVCVTYDLNDGNGAQSIEFAGTIKTVAKDAPVVETELLVKDMYSLTFSIAFADADEVGKVTNVILYSGDKLIEETGSAFYGEKTYENLGSYTCYTLSVVYEYDLGDGVGIRCATADLSVYTDPFIEFTSIDIRNTSAVSEGEAVVIVVEMDNPDGVTFSSVTINGTKYSVSAISTATSLYIEILNDGQFPGGETEITISQVVGTIGGATYTINVTENNVSTMFINGELLYNDFTVVRFDAQGRESEALYRFRNEELYYKISLGNSTGYDIYDVTIGSTTYSGENIFVSEDKQTVYVALPTDSSNGWRTDSFYGVSYGNENLENKYKAADMSTAYYRLKSNVGEVVEISTADQLLDMDDYYYYVLVNDIDLSGREWANMNNSMYGVFDGNGYTISGISAVTTYTDLDLYLGLFYNVEGVVMNLDVCDVLYYVFLENTTGNSYSVYAGGLSAKSNRVTLVNCQISSSIGVTNYGKGYVYVGAISGSGNSSTKLYNVVSDLSAEIDYVSGYYFNGYFGNSMSIDIFDSSCRSALTMKSDGSTYFADDEFTFSLIDGVYSLTGYLGSDTSIVLPENCNGNSYGIGYKAFYNDTKLIDITLPEGLLFIDGYAFYGCESLTSITIPESVTSIGSYAFAYCSNLGDITLGEDLTTICDYAFGYCTSMRSIVIPTNVASIGDNAFGGCWNLVEVWNLSELPIVAGAKTYGYVARFAAVVYSDKNEESRIIDTDDGYRFYQNGDAWYLVQYVGDDTDLVLPSYINGERYSIYGYAFTGDDSITSVKMPDTVTDVGEHAFQYCGSIESIEMSKGLTTIGTYAFTDCGSLTCIEIPENVTTIGTYAFARCYVLTAIYYNAVEVTSTDNYIFYYAGSKSDGITVLVGRDVKSIPSHLFDAETSSGAPKIVSVVFEEGNRCTSMGSFAFKYCISLVSIVLPSGIKSVGAYAFYHCVALTYVYYEGTPEDWNSISIESNNTYLTDATIYYYSETQPADTEYTYWHYVDGDVVLWDV